MRELFHAAGVPISQEFISKPDMRQPEPVAKGHPQDQSLSLPNLIREFPLKLNPLTFIILVYIMIISILITKI